MASLFDVQDALQAICIAATTPNGPGTIFGKLVDVGQGWPPSNDLDAAMKDGATLVSIYAVPGTTSDPGQVMNWDLEVVQPPVHGLSATATDSGFALSGCPGTGEYATAVLGRSKAYSYTAQPGDLAETVAAALASQIGADYPGTQVQGRTVTIPRFSSLVVRIGAFGIIGEQLHRQKQQFRIVVWAPTIADRAAVASALDVAIKRNLKIQMPDTSTALVTYSGLNLDDKFETEGTFRADLLFAVQWDTYALDDAYEVTAVDITFTAPQSILQSAF